MGQLRTHAAQQKPAMIRFSAPEEIADLLPAAAARVLITSRFSDWSGWAEEAALYVLDQRGGPSQGGIKAGIAEGLPRHHR